MPYLKSIFLRTAVNRSLSYILNPDKTEDLLYTNAVNCLPNARDAYLKAPDQQRAVRLKSLGEDYTIESLASRILWKDVGAGLNNPCERSALRDKYSKTIDGIQAVNANHPTLEQLGLCSP